MAGKKKKRTKPKARAKPKARVKARVKAKAATRKDDRNLQNLAKLTAIQMSGFIVLEIIVAILIAVGVLPPTLVLKQMGVVEVSINTTFIVIAGLFSVLIAAFWTAILAEVFGLIKMNEIKIKI